MPEIAQIILIPILSTLLLGLFGVGVVAPLAPATRNALLPAAPAVGAATIVAGLHGTGVFLAARWGIIVVLVVVAVLAGWSVRRGRRPWQYSGAAGAWLSAGLLVGVVGASVALLPSLEMGDSSVVSATDGHDAFYFVAGADWLADHRIFDAPVVGPAPGEGNALPSEGPAVSSDTIDLRWGLELLGAGMSSLTGTDTTDAFSPWLATWPLILPGICIAGAGLLGRRRASGAVAGVLVGTSAIFVHQVYNQNAASIFGICLILLFLPVAAAAVRGAVPVWFGGLLLGAIVGTYTELAPIIAPALVGGMIGSAALARRHARDHADGASWSSRWRRVVLGTRPGRTLLLVGLSVLLVPVAWLRGLRQVLANVPSGFDAIPSAYQFPDKSVVAARLTGVEPLDSVVAMHPVAIVLFALLTVGTLGVVALKGSRGLWLGALGGGAALVVYLTTVDRGYTQQRAVEVFFPLVIFAAVLGWDKITTSAPRAVRSVLLVALVGAACVWTIENTATSRAEAQVATPDRHVDGDFKEAAGWISELGGAEGDNTAVLAPSFFDGLWIADALRDLRRVAYPTLNPSYLTRISYWDLEPDRYLLVGRGTIVNADPAAVLRRNDRFELLDTRAGAVTVAAPQDQQSWEPFPDDEGRDFTNASATSVLVIGTRGASTIELTIGSRVTALDAELSADDGPVTRVTADQEKQATIRVADADADFHVIHLVNHAYDPANPGATAVSISGVGLR